MGSRCVFSDETTGDVRLIDLDGVLPDGDASVDAAGDDAVLAPAALQDHLALVVHVRGEDADVVAEEVVDPRNGSGTRHVHGGALVGRDADVVLPGEGEPVLVVGGVDGARAAARVQVPDLGMGRARGTYLEGAVVAAGDDDVLRGHEVGAGDRLLVAVEDVDLGLERGSGAYHERRRSHVPQAEGAVVRGYRSEGGGRHTGHEQGGVGGVGGDVRDGLVVAREDLEGGLAAGEVPDLRGGEGAGDIPCRSPGRR